MKVTGYHANRKPVLWARDGNQAMQAQTPQDDAKPVKAGDPANDTVTVMGARMD